MKRDHVDAMIAVMGTVAVILTGAYAGAIWASGLGVAVVMTLAFRSNAGQAARRALYYRRLERGIKSGRETSYGLLGEHTADGAARVYRGGYVGRVERIRDAALSATVANDDADGDFRVAGISFDRDAGASKRYLDRKPQPFDLGVNRLDRPWPFDPRYPQGPDNPKIMGNRVSHGAVHVPDGAGISRLINRHLPDDADPRCKGK